MHAAGTADSSHLNARRFEIGMGRHVLGLLHFNVTCVNNFNLFLSWRLGIVLSFFRCICGYADRSDVMIVYYLRHVTIMR